MLGQNKQSDPVKKFYINITLVKAEKISAFNDIFLICLHFLTIFILRVSESS